MTTFIVLDPSDGFETPILEERRIAWLPKTNRQHQSARNGTSERIHDDRDEIDKWNEVSDTIENVQVGKSDNVINNEQNDCDLGEKWR